MIRTPVIPENIVVHLGAPDAAAKNLTLPFGEYIKNVASGEIYPNWPLDAIKANVLAQISFALNRVYNEWYPSKGYSFDITSVPAYDQSFVENRQFFESISKVVDEIFNNYIVKGEQIQPLFARYCDGRVTTCEGLSQWGTVSLANQGKSPLQILRYYYGNDIKLIYNAPVGENMSIYPGFPIEIGTAGDFVRIIKIELNRIGINYPVIPAITDDSLFYTVETENAVKEFQRIFNLVPNGIVDKSTWYKIKYIYNAVKKISDLTSEGISKEEATLLIKQELKVGDKEYYIYILNYLLNVVAIFDDDIPYLNLSTDTYTKDTEKMVTAFQSKYGLPVTGVVNYETYAAIRSAYLQTLKEVPKDYFQGLDEFYPGRFLYRDLTGDDVVRLQRFLYIICEKTKSIPGVVVNGEFDSLTEASVKYIQQSNNIDTTGAVGPPTWDLIVKLSKGGN